MITRTIYIPNGELMVPYHFYECGNCNEEIGESDRHYTSNGKAYCVECSFRLGFIDSDEFLDSISFVVCGYEAGINPSNGRIEVKRKDGYFSWEMSPSQLRRTSQYQRWRKSVLERDGHMCQDCKNPKKRTRLHAHHIKPFAKHEKLRFCVDNGITLCAKCHRERHRAEGYR